MNLELAIVLTVIAAFGAGLWFAVSGRRSEEFESNGSTVVKNSSDMNRDGVRVIPDGLQSVTTYITVDDPAAAVDFYARAFGAVERPGRLTAPDGKVMHTTVSINNTAIMIADELLAEGSAMNSPGPATLGGVSFKLNLFVADAHAAMDQALAAGGELLIPVKKQFYGHLSGRVRDPFGHHWIISTPIEELDSAELVRRFDELFS